MHGFYATRLYSHADLFQMALREMRRRRLVARNAQFKPHTAYRAAKAAREGADRDEQAKILARELAHRELTAADAPPNPFRKETA